MTKDKTTKKAFSRRKFLTRGAVVLGSTVVATYFGMPFIRRYLAQTVENMDIGSMITSYDPDFWFEILDDNTILIRSPKVEMGQGIFTGFAMLAAEELEVPLSQIKVTHANTANGPVDSLSTGGSNSTSSLYEPIREVAASLREMLKAAAAQRWQVNVASIKVKDGVLSAGGKSITYAELAKTTKEWTKPKKPTLKPRSEFKYVGKDVPRIDLVDKVMGKPLYAIDHHYPDMLYAVLVQSPYIGGTLKKVNTKAAAATPGVVKILEEKTFTAIVAKTRYAAEMGLAALEAEWEVPKKWQKADFEATVTVGKGKAVNIQNVGNANSEIKTAGNKVFKQAYRTPLGAHAQMEPNGTVASYKDDKTEIVIGTQMPGMVRDRVAKAIGQKSKEVALEPAFAGGGFGRRMDVNNANEAALISKAVGKPVHVFNTREQEFQNSHYRPNTHHVLQAVINEKGDVTAITHDQATPDMVLESVAGDVGLAIFGADFLSAGHGASILYNVENRSTTLWQMKLPLKIGIWRSVGMFPNTFAVESFINELAHETKKDPLKMRLALLDGPEEINQRYQKVLKTLMKKSAWDAPKQPGIGRGVAIGNDRKSIAAAVIDVAIVDDAIVVKKVTHVIDAGVCINPNGIRMQVEGSIMMGISATLYEELSVEDGQLANNFLAYRLVTLADAPEIDITIVEGADIPYGVGEPPLAPIAPAIAAAVFDLTGKRLRSLPLQLDAAES